MLDQGLARERNAFACNEWKVMNSSV